MIIGLSSGAWAQQVLPAVVVNTPVDGPPADPSGMPLKGQGLCAAFRQIDPKDPFILSMFPIRPVDFPKNMGGTSYFSDPVNAYMDGAGMTTYKASYATMQTPFDLASQKVDVGGDPRGDFVDTPGCQGFSSAGCDFPASNGATKTLPYPSFGTRYRGFMVIPPTWQKLPMHFGFRTYNEVSMRIYEKADINGAVAYHDVVCDSLGAGNQQDFRVTQTVTFQLPGIYPVEILHAASNSPAVLEMAILFSNPGFTDVDETGSVGLKLSVGNDPFVLTLYTTPDRFFQTTTGAPAFVQNPAQCQQCPRIDAASATQAMDGSICPQKMYCNEAAVCSPCVGKDFCGSSCKKCMDPDKFCVLDPKPGGTDYVCVECKMNSDCPTGDICVYGKCISPPCNCCPDSPLCVVTDPVNHPTATNCSACNIVPDGNGGMKTVGCMGTQICDLPNGRCIDGPMDHNSDTDCGASATNCTTDTGGAGMGPPRKLCMNGMVCVECRFDSDCGAGTFCNSGSCMPCLSDRHCGPNCQNCGYDYSPSSDGSSVVATKGQHPHCYIPAGAGSNTPLPPSIACVGCTQDSDCKSGGCDPSSHTCANMLPCSMTCADPLFCDGNSGTCVECTSNAQCPCGQCVANKCSPGCADSTDCQGNQCCVAGLCDNTRCAPNLHGGDGLCCDTAHASVGGANDPVAPARSQRELWFLVAAMGLLTFARLRFLRSRATAGSQTGTGPAGRGAE